MIARVLLALVLSVLALGLVALLAVALSTLDEPAPGVGIEPVILVVEDDPPGPGCARPSTRACSPLDPIAGRDARA